MHGLEGNLIWGDPSIRFAKGGRNQPTTFPLNVDGSKQHYLRG